MTRNSEDNRSALRIERLFKHQTRDRQIVEYPDGRRYEGSTNDGVPHGYGMMSFQNNIIQACFGVFQFGELDGEDCRIVFNDAREYVGGFVKGRREGSGRMTWRKLAVIYEGEWLADLRHGKGWMMSSSGHEELAGPNWAFDQLSGAGFFVSDAGDRYEGVFSHHKLEGTGTIKFKNGDRFHGLFAGGLRNGLGTLTFKNGDTFVGLYKNNVRSGSGRFNWVATSRRFEGNWENDQRQAGTVFDVFGKIVEKGQYRDEYLSGIGFRLLTDQSGLEISFEGSFLQGVPSGQGCMIEATKDDILTTTGEFRQGKPNGECKICSKKTGTSYSGSVVDGKRSGFGSQIEADGSQYDGYFRDNIRCGEGKLRYKTGETFEGEFINGSRVNYGTVVTPDGRVYKGRLDGLIANGTGYMEEAKSRFNGQFKDNKLHGFGIYTPDKRNAATRSIGEWKNGNLVKQCPIPISSLVMEHLTQEEHGGRLLYPNGDIYSGDVGSNNRPHTLAGGSDGVLCSPDGTVKQRGKWIKGEFQPRRLALVIGIAEYSSFSHLEGPVNDANEIEKLLKSMDFTVRKMEGEVLLTGLVDAIFHDFLNSLKEGDICLLYFSGHGISFQNEDFLLSSDFTFASVPSEGAVSVPDIAHHINSKRQSVSVLLFDCCRVPFIPTDDSSSKGSVSDTEECKCDDHVERTRSPCESESDLSEPSRSSRWSSDDEQEEHSQYSSRVGNDIRITSPDDCQISIVFATQPGSIAAETPSGSPKLSVFTKALLPHLANEKCHFEEAVSRTIQDMRGIQRPWKHSNLDIFFLKPKSSFWSWIR